MRPRLSIWGSVCQSVTTIFQRVNLAKMSLVIILGGSLAVILILISQGRIVACPEIVALRVLRITVKIEICRDGYVGLVKICFVYLGHACFLIIFIMLWSSWNVSLWMRCTFSFTRVIVEFPMLWSSMNVSPLFFRFIRTRKDFYVKKFQFWPKKEKFVPGFEEFDGSWWHWKHESGGMWVGGEEACGWEGGMWVVGKEAPKQVMNQLRARMHVDAEMWAEEKKKIIRFEVKR